MKKLMRLHAVKEATGLGGSTIYRMMEKGLFPKPIPLQGNLVAWQEAEVSAWLEETIRAGLAAIANGAKPDSQARRAAAVSLETRAKKKARAMREQTESFTT